MRDWDISWNISLNSLSMMSMKGPQVVMSQNCENRTHPEFLKSSVYLTAEGVCIFDETTWLQLAIETPNNLSLKPKSKLFMIIRVWILANYSHINFDVEV